ncbi:hypothetical protein Taro_016011 [Colocasia esculenta]|uniref:Ribosomal protein S11 n=1 Tax=Colocasia esculenta TaxID=4460 RepID=A0A843UJ53_COLES|nr:hypothetical protein [Colocasia esculenta]
MAAAAAAIASKRGSSLLGKLLAPARSAAAAACAARSFSASARTRFVASFDEGGGQGDSPASPLLGSDRARTDFIRDVLGQTRGEFKHDIVHMLIMRNNSFVTVTDSKGNKKFGASAGSVGTGKSTRYACDATAEHVARTAVNLGPTVIKVNGISTFKKKKDAILSWKEGCSYGDRSKILQIHDVTRLAHNGCRRRKQRRI